MFIQGQLYTELKGMNRAMCMTINEHPNFMLRESRETEKDVHILLHFHKKFKKQI